MKTRDIHGDRGARCRAAVPAAQSAVVPPAFLGSNAEPGTAPFAQAGRLLYARAKRRVRVAMAIALGVLLPGRAFAIDPSVHVTASTRVRDIELTPIDLGQSGDQMATGKAAVSVPISVNLSDAYGPGTATAQATGQAGFLRCRTTAAYPYVIRDFTHGGGSSAETSIEVYDYVTVTSPTLPAGTVVAIAFTMKFRGVNSATSAQQARPGIVTEFHAFLRCTSSVDDQLQSMTNPNPNQRDLGFSVNAKVGETFMVRYELDTLTGLQSDIPDIRSMETDVYTGDNMAWVTMSPIDPSNVVLITASGAAYNGTPPVPPAPVAVAPWVSETPAELAGGLDADGDGREDFVVVDKVSGIRRLGVQQADGSFSWSEPASTGVDGVTGLGIGQFADATKAEGFAVASPAWNRVHVFADAAGGATVAPSVGIGPNLVVGFDFSGDARDDLAIGTEWDKGEDFTHLSGLATGTGILSHVYGPRVETGTLARGNRARFATDRPWMMGALRETNGGREFVTRPFFGFPGFADGPTLDGLVADTEWAWGQFRTNGAASFVFYSPGSPDLYVPGLDEPVAFQYAWTAGTLYNLGRPIMRVLVVPKKDGAMLLVMFGDGGNAGTYDFDGDHAPVPRQDITPPAGNGFSVGGALGNGDFIALTGSAGGAGASTGWQRWGFDGTKHSVTASGTLPAIKPSQGRANVLLFGTDPDLDRDSPLIRSLGVGEWSDAAVPVGSSLHVTREQYLGPTLGLGSPGTIDVPVVASGLFPAANQRASAWSMAVLSPPAPAPFAELTFSPAPGTYHADAGSVLVVRFLSAIDAPIQYRSDHAARWSVYDPLNPPRISATTRFEAFVDVASPGPIRPATYIIADAPVIAPGPRTDADGNGLPDAWESAFGVKDPNGDPDGDGFTNLQEYLGGSDPLDAESKPGSDLRTVAMTTRLPGSGAPAGTVCEIAWPATVAGVVFESSADIDAPEPWEVIAGPIATVGTERVYYQPESVGHETRYYRLRADP